MRLIARLMWLAVFYVNTITDLRINNAVLIINNTSVGTILKIKNRSISIDFRAENRDFDFCQSIFFSQKIFFQKKKYSAWNHV